MRGRRRSSQKNEDQKNPDNLQTGFSSEDTSYQIAPFSSFSEMIDLEDFIIYHSNLEPLKNDMLGELGKGLFRFKRNEIRA